MGKKKKEYRIDIVTNDNERDIVYRLDNVLINNRNINLYLSEECIKIFNEDYYYNKIVETVGLIFDKINIQGKEYKLYCRIESFKILFNIIIDGNVIENNYMLDDFILNTCFGICVKNLIGYEYVDFDKYF